METRSFVSNHNHGQAIIPSTIAPLTTPSTFTRNICGRRIFQNSNLDERFTGIFQSFLYTSTEYGPLAHCPYSPRPEGLGFGKDTRESASRNTEIPKIRVSSGFVVVSMLRMVTEICFRPSRTSHPSSVLSLDFRFVSN